MQQSIYKEIKTQQTQEWNLIIYLFIYFGPRKAKGKYTILFIYLFSFCDNLMVIMRKRNI